MNASAKAPPALPSGHADDALGHALLTMRPGWIALHGCVLDTGDAVPAPVRYALLHPQIGIALLDVVPGQTTPHAPDHMRRALEAATAGAEFGCVPPILYFCIPVRALPDVGYLLEYEFSRQPPSPPLRGDAWVAAAQAILSARPLRHALPAWQQPARRFGGGARLLAGFWGFVALTVGGGALFLQILGPPEQAARAAAPLLIAKAEAGQGPPAAVDRAPSAKADASKPGGADLRRTLIENDRAIQELQNRLKEPRADAGSGMVANAVLTAAVLPGAAVERRVGKAARAQEVADTSEESDAAPAQEEPSASPAQDATAGPVDTARAEASLRQIRADAEAAQRRLSDTNAQAERAGQQVKAAEEQLATLQHQSEDAQTTGAAMGKQLTDAQAQLSQLEEQRSATEQQLKSLQAQADRVQADQAMVEQQLAAAKAELAEQQAKALAAQADRGKADASDADRPAEPREPADRAAAQPSLAAGQPEAAPSKPASTEPAAPVEAARAGRDLGDGIAPAPAAAAPVALRDGAAIAAASPATTPSLPNRAPDPAAAALAETMVRRGDALLQRGDISAARLLYDRAASAGSARAATAMGKTYDATVLAGVGAVGLSPDPALAAQWYRRGLGLGDEEARARLQSLPPAAGQAAARAERP